MDLGLRGKTAMVAGGSRGLGFATAMALAREGASISIVARDESALREAADRIRAETGAEVVHHSGDLRHPHAISAWRDATLSAFGGVNLLFANTGGPSPGTFETIDDAGWQEGVELLLFPMIRMVRETIPSMRQAGGGSILISTSAAVKVPILHLTVSTVIRGAVSSLSRTLAEQYASENIRVNQIVPGRIDTERVRSLDELRAERDGISVEEHQERSFGDIPLGRYGRPREYGEVAAFLLSERASFITGSTIQVDGGLIRSVL